MNQDYFRVGGMSLFFDRVYDIFSQNFGRYTSGEPLLSEIDWIITTGQKS
jgi:hypothetical protein